MKSDKLVEQQQAFTRLVAQLITWTYEQGYALTFGEAYRTLQQQRWYVDQGLSHTLTSRHRDRRAIDLNLFVDGKYQTDYKAYLPLGEYWKSLDKHCVWGGDWETLRDANHFEYFSPEAH
jgi:hypothetical protein